ncbi:hypothetical protein [Fusibacter bizertensis]
MNGLISILIEFLFRFWFILPMLLVIGIYLWKKNRRVSISLISIPIIISMVILGMLFAFSNINTPFIDLKSLDKFEQSLNEKNNYALTMDEHAYRTLRLSIEIKVDRTLQTNEIEKLKFDLVQFLKSEELKSDIDKFMLKQVGTSKEFQEIYICVLYEDNIILELENSDY